MINKHFRHVIPVMVFALLLMNCAYTMGKFAVVSTKKIDWSRAAEFTRGDTVEGIDMARIIIVWPTKSMISIEGAVNNALEKIPGAVALIDAVIKQKWFYFPFIYGKQGIYIEGTVIIDPKLVLVNEESNNYLVFYTEAGKDFKKTTVSRTEYLSYVQ